MPPRQVVVAGGGLAGSEAAWQLAQRGVPVELWEMRPARMTSAHTSGRLAELVCSNSLGSESCRSATGLLKAEARELQSMLLSAADQARVPAGQALAVDRERFAAHVEERLTRHPLIRLVRDELASVPGAGLALLATGPLTSDSLASEIAALTGAGNLHFFDAVAPIVVADTVDLAHAYWASRYDMGGADYLNCPLDEAQYAALLAALLAGEQHPEHDFERGRLFEACLPVEELARRGLHTLRFGPLKPVGLPDPRTGETPFAVVQLRREDQAGQLLNLVGFQTNLTYSAQAAALRLIPALARAEFARHGKMHRNTFVRAPEVLRPTLECRCRQGLFMAGQLTGVEGYTEAIATGLLAGINLAARAYGREPIALPAETVLGSLCNHVSSSPSPDFQPMNANWGLLPSLPGKVRRRDRPARHTARSLAVLKPLAEQLLAGAR